MIFEKVYHKLCFRLRDRGKAWIVNPIRSGYWRLQGMRVAGRGQLPRLWCTWPHQVAIGANCYLEEDIYFKFDGSWAPGPSIVIGNCTFIGRGCEFNIRTEIVIGADCLIGSGCKFIDHEHGMADREIPMKIQNGEEARIVIGRNVWLGVNVVVLKGVSIGEGSVVAAGSVVTKSIEPGEIWGGVPARLIRKR